MPRLLDTNALLHFFVESIDAERFRKAGSLMQRAVAGEESLVVTPVVLFELAFLLQRTFRLQRSAVAARLSDLLLVPAIEVVERPAVEAALEVYRATGGLSFADAYSVAYMQGQGITEVYSWDTDFDRVPGITRVEPA